MAALFAFKGSQLMSTLLSAKSIRAEVCLCGSANADRQVSAFGGCVRQAFAASITAHRPTYHS
jgi:hypothetical protein